MKDQEAMSELETFFDRYRQALENADVVAVLAAYRTPLPVIRPDRVVMVETMAVLRVEILKILDFYRWCGMRRLGMADFRVDGYDPGLHVVSLAWRPMTSTGEEVASIDVTYAVRRVTDGARICAVIAHNEERRRTPIIRESLDALGK